MWGYEDLEDIEASVRYVSTSQPDIFFTTVSYPIKGTLYYKRCLIVSNRLVRLQPSATSSDRNLKIKSRHSQQFYSYAGKLLEDELQLARPADTRTVDFKLAASLRHSFQPPQAGLLSSLSEVEA